MSTDRRQYNSRKCKNNDRGLSNCDLKIDFQFPLDSLMLTFNGEVYVHVSKTTPRCDILIGRFINKSNPDQSKVIISGGHTSPLSVDLLCYSNIVPCCFGQELLPLTLH